MLCTYISFIHHPCYIILVIDSSIKENKSERKRGHYLIIFTWQLFTSRITYMVLQ